MATRSEDLAGALFAVASANHYMVGIVEPMTDEEISEAEQILIARQNETAEGSALWQTLDLALDLVELMEPASEV